MKPAWIFAMLFSHVLTALVVWRAVDWDWECEAVANRWCYRVETAWGGYQVRWHKNTQKMEW